VHVVWSGDRGKGRRVIQGIFEKVSESRSSNGDELKIEKSKDKNQKHISFVLFMYSIVVNCIFSHICF